MSLTADEDHPIRLVVLVQGAPIAHYELLENRLVSVVQREHDNRFCTLGVTVGQVPAERMD
jgi:hypothetical protein